MDLKYKVIAVTVVAVGSFAAGRWMAPTKVETKVVEVEKIVTVKEEQKRKDKKTVITKKPDGETTTVITEITDTNTSNKTVDLSLKSEQTKKEMSTSKVTVSALAGFSLTNPSGLLYGVSISKPVLGPLTLGVFGFQDKRVGFSIGFTF